MKGHFKKLTKIELNAYILSLQVPI